MFEKAWKFHLFFLLCFALPLFSEDFPCTYQRQSSLMDDLLLVDYLNKKVNQRFPVVYDHLLQGGYFSMPSARMGPEGDVGIGYAWVPPYYQYNLRLQLVDFLEVSGSYRVFRGVEDPQLTRHGFGDYSDKGANVKLALFKPEDSHYRIPGLAIGLEDFMGTSSFKAYYVVLTQVLINYNLELTLGYGAHRIHKWFGGMNWMPFRNSSYKYLQNLSFVMEYDAIPYKDELVEKHPKGRVKRSPINAGIKYRLWDLIDFSASYIRGDEFAFSISTSYNFGATKGIVPKMENKLPYSAPVNIQELGDLRPEDVMMQDFIFAMQEQGLDVTEGWLSYENCQKVLRIKVVNLVYREECSLRERIMAILLALTPQDIDKAIVVIDAFMICCQEYHFDMNYLRLYQCGEMGRFEIDLLTPLKEVSCPSPCSSKLVFKKHKDFFNIEVMPRTQTLFGSSLGKFKYTLGLTAAFNGFLWDDVYYSVQLGWFAISDLKHVNDIDILNPSQLLCVRSDIINYYKQRSVTIDEAYLEKIWNWGRGWYTKIAAGLLEIEYAGAASEWLYYPVNSQWAVGMDFAVLKKRTPDSYGFTSFVRKLHGYKPHWYRFIGTQYSLNLYYDWKCSSVLFKVNAGKFLADDFGARFELSRYFPSGLQVGFWYTLTNGNDRINGHVYYDKGVFFSMPLDIFYTRSSRSRWGYGMSAWLRDVGARAQTGTELYNLINQQRQD